MILKIIKKIILLVMVLGFLSSASADSNSTTRPGNLAEPIDETLFEQLSVMAEVSKKNELWQGYDYYAGKPQYLVYITRSAGDRPVAVRGFLINPFKELEGATKLSDAEAKGLDIYRYDKVINDALEHVSQSSGVYAFEYEIEGGIYFLQVYSDETVEEKLTSAINIHEIFHTYTFFWDAIPGFDQDLDNYPINESLLALQILSLDVLSKLPDDSLTKEQMTELLKQYVAIRSQEIKLDPTDSKLVKNMANPQEQNEGAPVFVEVMTQRLALGSRRTFVPDVKLFDLINFDSQEAMKSFFRFGIWYSTGSAVTYLLDRLGADLEKEYAAGKTPYDVAAASLNMSQADKDVALKKAQAKSDWQAIQAKAQALTNLK